MTEVAGVNNPVTLFSVLYAERGSAERAVMAGIVVEATNAAAELLGDEVAEELLDVVLAAADLVVLDADPTGVELHLSPNDGEPDQGGYRCTCHVYR